ncbi:major facilitator superfamily domain-containing protein [Coniella lustricola]|uniref:Major facilitator superfamily domain-containing protein n=1 Tax=Coniella lustricola TaxID=2025994 RepID=A0A2T3A0B0_9PEZI|nr:major facilitator superfamily domain-containing protein [Coniella lustricola]
MATTSLPDASSVEKTQTLEDTRNTEEAVIDTNAETPVPSLESDKYAVTWDEPAEQDPENPMSWTVARKWSIIGILSFLSFLTPLASSMMAPAVPLIMEDFGVTSSSIGTFCVSVFVLGFAFGPMIIAPCSEVYGRSIVYHVCNVLFVIFTIACGLSKNMGMFIAFRFCAGFAGVAVLTCGSGTIADITPPEMRGKAMGIWSIGPMIGPVVGPVCAGFLVEDKSWHWVFWIIAIFAGATTIASLFILRETYAPVILERKAARLRKQTGVMDYHSSLQLEGTSKQIFMAALLRPARLLILVPVVTSVCVYIAVVYGLMYILFTTFTFVYEETYHFSSEGSGLSFIAGGVGNLLGLAYVSILSDRLVQRRIARNLPSVPESRLHPLLIVPTTILLPVGLIIYGWTAYYRVHWIVPMIGTGIMGWGMIGVFSCCQTYLVDAYTRHAASVTAANAVLRSVLGALMPLCGLKLYDAIGLGWGNTLLAGIALLLAPVPLILGKYGQKIRENPKFQLR